MRIDLWFDPGCPWCWATSRWLLEVQEERDFTLVWRLISLWCLNHDTASAKSLEHVLVTHRMLRVCAALEEREGNAAVGRLYTVLGTAIHHDHNHDVDLVAALASAGCDTSLVAAADDARWDAVINADMDEGLALAGEDVGTPLIGVDGRAAYFGPIMSPAPTGEAALQLFDALITMSTQDGFFELKRTRATQPQFGPRPDVPETRATA